jgi:hypothetical protein
MTGKSRALIILVPVIALLLAVGLVPRSAMAGPPRTIRHRNVHHHDNGGGSSSWFAT